MKTRVIIGDIHGRDTWKKIIEKENPNYVIFLGDYFDSFNITPAEQKENFLDIVAYKDSKAPCEVTLLLGNHDFHYIGSVIGERYSGWNAETANKIGYILGIEIDKGMPVVFIDSVNKTIYSHAGVSEKWANTWVNGELGLINTVTYDSLKFTYRDGGDWHGSSVWNSPIWIRPDGLYKYPYKDHDNAIWNQVFGHTQQIQPTKHVIDEAEFWNMDSLGGGYYMKEKLAENGKLISREIFRI